MKTLLCLGVVAVAFASSARADLLVEYNLNSVVDAGSFGIAAFASPTGGIPANSSNVINFNSGAVGNLSIVSGASGAPGDNAVRFASNTPNPSVTFSFTSSGYENLTISFNYLSGGPTTASLGLSIVGPGGMSVPLGIFTSGGTAFSSYTSPILPSGFDNLAASTFTISLLNNGDGSFAFDNITVSGSAIGLAPIPEPTEIALPLFGLLVGGIWLYRRQKGGTASVATAA